MHIDDDAPTLIVAPGHSLAFGARFLKRVIDERVTLPTSARWRDGSCFHVRAHGSDVVVDVAREHGAGGQLASASYEQVA